MNRGDLVDVVANTRIAGEGRELLAHPDVAVDGVYDVWIGDGRIVDVAPAGALRRRGVVLDAQGAWLVPGLWDHHVHTLQWALAQTRLSVEHTASPAEAARAVLAADVRGDGRRIGVRARDGLWPEPPSLAAIDETTGEVPTYLVNADLHSVWLNSAAFRREGLAPPDTTGILREDAAFAVQAAINAVPQQDEDVALDRVLRQAASRGIVGIQDLEMGGNAERWRHRIARGHDVLRVRFDVYPDDLGRAISEGLATGDPLDGSPLVQAGMLKVISDGSLGTRTASTSRPYPDGHGHGLVTVAPEELTELVTRAAGAGIATTIHAIGDVANRHALDAFAAVDVPGRIEHAQLVARADLPRFARLGVSASIQPEHALDDRDLVEANWDGQTAVAYPLRELAEAGADILLGSDAPVAPLDPWISMAAAVFRTRGDEEPWRPYQTLDARTALAASTDGGSADGARLLPGGRADLALVAHDPLAASAQRLRTMPVLATLLAGRVTHLS